MQKNPANLIKGNELDLIKEKIKHVTDFLDPSNIDLDNSDLGEMITLGDNWDDPMSLMKALDEHASYFARWSYLYRMAQRKLEDHADRYKTWESTKKERIRQTLFNKNIKAGMTPSTAKPTDVTVNNKFSSIYSDKCEQKDAQTYFRLKKNLSIYEIRVEKVKIVVEAFKQRSSLLVSMASLLKSMVDNNLLVLKKKRH